MSELKRTPLYERHIQLGAKMVPFAGFSMPVSYASVKDEILSVRNQTGIFDISHMQPIMIEARNSDISISFLNKITARPIPPFSAGEVQYNALINQNGGIIDDILVYMFANGNVGIVANAANADKVIQFLGNHADDHIAIVPAQDYAFLAVQGKGSEKIVRETIGSFAEIFYYQNTTLASIPESWVSRTGYTGEDGFEIFCSAKNGQLLWDKFLAAGVNPCGLAARDTLRIEMLYPLYGNELSEELTPKACGLQFLVKKKKETIAGEKLYEDHQQTSMGFNLTAPGVPRAGYEVYNNESQRIGSVTSGTHSFSLNSGFGIASITDVPENNQIFIDIRGKKIPATLTSKPLIPGSIQRKK